MEYYVFVLGYDLLQELLMESETPCDVAYDLCEEIYNDFLKSGYNVDTKSGYDCLHNYISDNYDGIRNRIQK
jgi:hypothetical protein